MAQEEGRHEDMMTVVTVVVTGEMTDMDETTDVEVTQIDMLHLHDTMTVDPADTTIDHDTMIDHVTATEHLETTEITTDLQGMIALVTNLLSATYLKIGSRLYVCAPFLQMKIQNYGS